MSPVAQSRSAHPANGVTLTQRAYKTLHDEIVSGSLSPGERLVRRTLSARLGVSPAPITEALLRLEGEGLVESESLSGARVLPLRLSDVDNDQTLREAIECQAARLCAEKASAESLANLLKRAKPLDGLIARQEPRSQIGLQSHLEFHVSLAQLGGCPALANELEKIWFRQVMRLNWLGATWHRNVPEDWHAQLVHCIATRDPDVAESKMREHVRFAKDLERQQFVDFVNQRKDEVVNSPRLNLS